MAAASPADSPVRLPLLMRAAEVILTAATDEATVLRAAMDLLGDHFGYGIRSVLLYEPDKEELHVVCSGGIGADRPEVMGFRVKLGVGLTGACAQLRAIVNAGDVRRDPRYIRSVEESRSEICVPIVARDELLGVMTVQSDRLDAFSADDETALTAFVQLLALGLMNARAHAARSRDVNELQALADVAREATTLNLRRTLDTAVDRFRALTASDSTAIYVYDAATNELWPGAVSFDENLYPADYVSRIGRVPMGQGIVGWVAEHREPILSDDVGKDARGQALPGIPRENKSGLSVPLLAEGQLRGVIRANRMGIAQYTREHLRLAQTIASQAALAIAAVQAHEQARWLAITDELTGCFNARYLGERLGPEVERARRHERPLALLIVDSDSLKAVNDECGHACGDRLLAELAATIRGQVRSTDIVARYGGDEFVVVAPETDLAAARVTAERIRRAVCVAKFATPEGVSLTSTVSVGVAELGPMDDASALFGRADRALYAAKRAGKDRVADFAA